jgi:hypothetical protein
MGDDAGRDRWVREIDALARDGRYPASAIVTQLANGFAAFARGDFPAAIAALAPAIGELERVGGSRAQLDLIEFTLLKAYLNADRPDDARRLCIARRPGPRMVL